jgi:hypothetical protein
MAVVFLNSDEPTIGHSTGGATRLLMHGSDEHLVGGTAASSVSRDDIRFPAHYTELRLFALLLSRLNRRSASSDSEPDADEMELPDATFESRVPDVIEIARTNQQRVKIQMPERGQDSAAVDNLDRQSLKKHGFCYSPPVDNAPPRSP